MFKHAQVISRSFWMLKTGSGLGISCHMKCFQEWINDVRCDILKLHNSSCRLDFVMLSHYLNIDIFSVFYISLNLELVEVETKVEIRIENVFTYYIEE